MKSVRYLSDAELLHNTRSLAEKEREVIADVIAHLNEIYLRRLFAPLGYSSIHEYAVRELKYSDGAAHRRIQTMRALYGLPESDQADARKKLESGTLNITTMSLLQNFIRTESREQGRNYTPAEKLELMRTIEGQSKEACERTLAAISPLSLPRERERALTATETEIKFVADSEFMSLLNRSREIAPSKGGGGTAMLLKWALKVTLKYKDPLVKANRNRSESRTQKEKLKYSPQSLENGAEFNPLPSATTTLTALPHSRHIPKNVKDAVWRRDQAQCTFVSSDGRRCASRNRLQLDHTKAYAHGGDHTTTNLRLRCFAHNQWTAIETFGRAAMARHVGNLRKTENR